MIVKILPRYNGISVFLHVLSKSKLYIFAEKRISMIRDQSLIIDGEGTLTNKFMSHVQRPVLEAQKDTQDRMLDHTTKGVSDTTKVKYHWLFCYSG